MNNVTETKYRIALSRFRTSSHSLFIETGRYDNTPSTERICKTCGMNQTEDEYHFLLACPGGYRAIRSKYFKPYFCHWPPLNKFEALMLAASKKVLNDLAKLIYFANKIRIS